MDNMTVSQARRLQHADNEEIRKQAEKRLSQHAVQGHAIIWLTQVEIAILLSRLEEIKNLPDYFLNDLQSMKGRALRGQIWTNFEIPSIAKQYFSSPLGTFVSMFCGGIVIDKTDVSSFTHIPGIITDFELNRFPN